MNRRSFLKTTLAIAPMIVSARVFGANERVNVGLIGLGGRCRGIARDCLGIPEMNVVSVCDCFRPRVDGMLGGVGKDQGWKGYTDFREMFDKEKLDGVMVETTTHARAWVACNAMAAGMDAYIEKPMSLTIAEGRDMVNVARKYKRVTQVGTQQRSIPLNTWASDLVKNGHIGKIKAVHAPNFMGPNQWTPREAQDLPAGGDEGWWDIWTNQAEFRPYHEVLHKGWNNWRAYDGGGQCYGVTGWGAHSYDQIQRGLGTDETGPVAVVLEEEPARKMAGNFTDRPISPKETGSPYYGMVKKSKGVRAKVRMTYANGTELLLDLDADCSPGLGCRFLGEKGFIEINRDKISSDNDELIQGPGRPATLGERKIPENEPHIRNWVECIKTRKRCNADIEYGQRASTICYLVNIARDVGSVGKKLKWNPKRERFTNCKEGNAMLSRPRRKGYELPA